jgi:hypothetical protein
LLSATAIGSIVGDLSGTSQDSVAGQLVPALLTLVGIFGAYVFGKEAHSRGVINISILCFVLALSISYAYANINKKDYATFMFCREKYSDVSLLENQAAFDHFDQIFSTYCDAVISRYTGTK